MPKEYGKSIKLKFVGRGSLILIVIFVFGCEREKGLLKIAIYSKETTNESYLLILYSSRE